MQILEAYLHTLDSTITKSENPLAVDPAITEYFEGHFLKLFEAMETVKMPLDRDSKIYMQLEASKETGEFSIFTGQLADAFFDLMPKCEGLKEGVLACVLFEANDTTYFGMLKLNYRTSYFHSVNMISERISNQLSVKHSTLPGKSQAVDEAFIIDLDDLTLYLRDKELIVDGKRVKYLSENILGITSQVSVKKALNIIEKAVKDETDPVKTAINKAKISSYVRNQIEEGEPIRIQEIASQCYESTTERQLYETAIKNKGVYEDVVETHAFQNIKVKSNHKIKTEAGIEIILPEYYLVHPENFEVIHEEDGTMSIKLKRIGAIL